MDISGIFELAAAIDGVLLKLIEAVLQKLFFGAIVLLSLVICSICYLCIFEPRLSRRQQI